MDIYTDASFSYNTQRAGLGVFVVDKELRLTYNVEASSIASAELSAILGGCIIASPGDTVLNDNLPIVRMLQRSAVIKNNEYWSGCIIRIVKTKALRLRWCPREDDNQRIADRLAKLSLRKEDNNETYYTNS